MACGTGADDDDGNEADEMAEGADRYAEARISPGMRLSAQGPAGRRTRSGDPPHAGGCHPARRLGGRPVRGPPALARARTNRGIAARLCLSEGTGKNHVSPCATAPRRHCGP
ncbi:hypothetical protein TUSST3_14080 [Streptomyces sp. TUS-ST3]|nr:hypothetical protein TUSST3_14080 [Streptomyces sp. TUS-ST3]